jgi:hypothetical protein
MSEEAFLTIEPYPDLLRERVTVGRAEQVWWPLFLCAVLQKARVEI